MPLTRTKNCACTSLQGKYNSGTIPPDSRLAKNVSLSFIKEQADQLATPEGRAKIAKVKVLEEIAKELGEDVTTSQLALAWTAKHPNVRVVVDRLILKEA